MKRLFGIFERQLQSRFGPAYLLIGIIVALSFITRMILLFLSLGNISYNPMHILLIFIVGTFYDIISALFFSGLLILYLWLIPRRIYRQRWQMIFPYIYIFISLLILVFNVAGEIIFWKEYGNRYDFIAVDYLIYTQEVISNIIESYPVTWIFSGITIIALTLFLFTRKYIDRSKNSTQHFTERTAIFCGYLLIVIPCFLFLTNSFRKFSENRYTNELAGNGIYEFATAYFSNEINYTQKYATVPDKEAFRIVREQLAPGTTVSDSLSISRSITNDSSEKKWNIVLISVESLSRSYMGYFGSKDHLTPVLDSLIPRSIFFSNFYATGTRTVRGLEALSLSIPPTPGQSIVRRPHNAGLFSLGELMRSKNYDCRFIYGGRSWFDNMGPYFSANGYTVVDKDDFNKDERHFSTAWGYCDEDIYTRTLNECDKSFASGKLFFNHVMTVSNHRPYTFPKGRVVNNPDDQSREGAVAYTDWAIGDFLNRAKNKPWFNNTLFVIVADHCASAAGKTELPVSGYQIPCFIYAPALIQPQIVDKLVSQIDLIPTMLGMMNLHYTSKFFGYDIFRMKAGTERAFISTYQQLGYLKGNKLVILSPGKEKKTFGVDSLTGQTTTIAPDNNLINEAIAWYQTASTLFKRGGYRFKD